MSWDAARRHSRVLGIVREVRRSLDERLDPVARRLRTTPLVSPVRGAADSVTAAGHIAIRGSGLYRWLTTEPDADVVMIDLRETRTIGPLLYALGRIGRPLADRWRGSRAERSAGRLRALTARAPVAVASGVVALLLSVYLAATLADGGTSGVPAGHLFLLAVALLGLRERRSWSTLGESRPVRLAVAVFAPPEPPDERS